MLGWPRIFSKGVAAGKTKVLGRLVAAGANIATPWQRDQRRIETIAKTEQLSDLLSLRK